MFTVTCDHCKKTSLPDSAGWYSITRVSYRSVRHCCSADCVRAVMDEDDAYRRLREPEGVVG